MVSQPKVRSGEMVCGAIIVLCGLFIGYSYYAGYREAVAGKAASLRSSLPVPRDPISLVGLHVEGGRAAKIILIVISDFQCPYCGRFAMETLPSIRKEYVEAGKVVLAFQHMPLAIHSEALGAAEAAECAAFEGRFWAMHDTLFERQQDLREDKLRLFAQEVGLDRRRFSDCIKSHETRPAVDASVAAAGRLGITGTPSFLVGRIEADGRARIVKTATGAVTAETMGEILDEVLRTQVSGAR